MKRSVRIKQHDITDCGAACLASVAAHYKLLLPIARIRQIASTDQKGTNVLGLIEAAQKIGFQAKGVKGSPDSLLKIPKPSIAHVVTASGLHHYVVIYKVTAKSIVIMDPADGRLYYKKHKEFHQEWSGVLILLLPTEEFQSGNERVSTIKRFWALLQPHRSVLLQALFGALIQTLLGLSTSIFIQKITDHVLPAENKNLLNLLGCLMIILLLFQTFIGVTKSIFALYTGQRIDAQLILGYYKHLLRLPQSFFDTMRVGEIISRVNDAVKIRVFINEVALNLVVQVLTITFAFGLMVTYYWKLALLLLLLIPLYGILYWLSNRLNRKQVRNLMEESARLETQLVESLQSAATIKRFSLENFMNTQTETRFIGLLRIIRLSGLSGLGIGTASGFITSLFTILILWIGSYYVIERELTPGELLSFYALIGYFTGPISTLIQSNRAIQDALIAADRLFEILDLERESQHPTADIQPELMGDIRFHEVAFRYGSRIQVFNDLSLVIPRGKLTAIVGESGSGKSTLLSLLQNLYPLQKGTIFLGQQDIRYLKPESLRTFVGVVPQQIDLFAGTVLQNIAVGECNPDLQRVITLCNALEITSFVEKLPGGFNALLGERGANLSGGQRQRLAIARALYRNPEILILDEATSALDSIAEQSVQQMIRMLQKAGKTIIVIAHRLSTVRNADQIIVLKQGQVQEIGTHDELLQKQGNYTELWRRQMDIL